PTTNNTATSFEGSEATTRRSFISQRHERIHGGRRDRQAESGSNSDQSRVSRQQRGVHWEDPLERNRVTYAVATRLPKTRVSPPRIGARGIDTGYIRLPSQT